MQDVSCINNVCLDKPIYEFSKHTLFGCKINPNVITSINLFIFTPLIFLNIINNSGYIFLLLLCLIRAYLDILDGSIARRCNMKSKFGLLYDYIGDFIITLGISLIVLYNIYKYGKVNTVLSTVVVILFFFICFQSCKGLLERIQNFKKRNYDTKKINTKVPFYERVEKIFADNSIIMTPLFIFWPKLFINYLRCER